MRDERPTHIDLFSGIGGFALAAQWAGFRTIAFCEIDRYCQKVLAKNFMADTDGSWKSSSGENNGVGRQRKSVPKIHANIFDFNGTAYRGCDLITGGFPCQPFSVAGKRRGAADDRALWPEMLRVISEARPAWVLGENVPGIIPMELDNVLSDLEGIGYACRSFVIPACAVDARHRRDRLWIVGCSDALGHSQCERFKGGTEINSGQSLESGGKTVADTENSDRRWSNGTNNRWRRDKETRRCSEQSGGVQHWLPESRLGGMVDELSDWLDRPFCTFPPEPNIPRVAHAVKHRTDRLKGLGNSIVARVAYEILREIRKLIT
jgi:DNA (cytosine-5)-methyltransferase 1